MPKKPPARRPATAAPSRIRDNSLTTRMAPRRPWPFRTGVRRPPYALTARPCPAGGARRVPFPAPAFASGPTRSHPNATTPPAAQSAGPPRVPPDRALPCGAKRPVGPSRGFIISVFGAKLFITYGNKEEWAGFLRYGSTTYSDAADHGRPRPPDGVEPGGGLGGAAQARRGLPAGRGPAMPGQARRPQGTAGPYKCGFVRDLSKKRYIAPSCQKTVHGVET